MKATLLSGAIVRMAALLAVIHALPATEAQGNPVLGIEQADGQVQLSFTSEASVEYRFQISTALPAWEDFGDPIPGDGSSRTQSVTVVAGSAAFFRLVATPSSQDVAPTESEFAARVVGTTLLGYTFTSDTRFSWFGEPGNWSYTKTGTDTGTLIFTYDEDGNNGAVYREEVLLTFQTQLQGTFRYSEYNSGVEDPGSVSTGTFQFNTP